MVMPESRARRKTTRHDGTENAERIKQD